MAVALPHASLAAQLPEDNNESLEMATSSLTASPDSRDDVPIPMPGDFDVVQHYADLLQRDEVGCQAHSTRYTTDVLIRAYGAAPRYAGRCYRVISPNRSSFRG
jgi:hypothetical protein